MPLTLNCPKCRKPFRVRDDAAGQKVRCPNCQAVLQVPGTPKPAEATTAATAPVPPVREPAPAPSPPTEPLSPRAAARARADEDDTQAAHPVLARDEDEEKDDDTVRVPERGRGRHHRADREAVDLDEAAETAKPGPGRDKTKKVAKRKPEEEPEDPEEVIDGWDRVYRGLGRVSIGLFLLLIPSIAYFAKAVMYLMQGEEKKPEPGFLGISGMHLWDDILLLAIGGSGLLAFLLLLLGRGACARAPRSSHAGGLAKGSLFFTLLTFIALGGAGAAYLMPKLGLIEPVSGEITTITFLAAAMFALIAEGWFGLFLAQIGWPLDRPKLAKEVALFGLVVVVLAVGVVIANQVLIALDLPDLKAGIDGSIREKAHGLPTDEVFRQSANAGLISGGVLLILSVLFVFRYTAVTAAGRRAIRHWLKEHEPEPAGR